MSKRNIPSDDTERPNKKHRAEQPGAVQEIQFARQLQDLLTFSQDGIQQLRTGIASLKAFLESILYHRDEANRARQLSILREYLESQKPSEGQEIDRPFLRQLWQAWSFADQNNNDVLASAVSSILAQILKTLSSLLDFREYGTLLCRTILQHQHLRFLKRCVGAPGHKDFVISPCLRLLTEVTGFDGGVFAREVYKRREQTFDVAVFRRNLGLIKTDISEEDLQRKPSIRTLALRYILALLKHLHEGGKADLLKSRPLCAAVFSQLRNDPPDLVNEVLSLTEQHVLKDNDLSRTAKANLLTPQSLERVTEIATRSGDDHPTSEKAFAWLKAVCTIPTYGILIKCAWYPPGTTSLETADGGDFIDLGLDSIEFYDREEPLEVRNRTLLSWIRTLRPQSDLKERELLVACLQSAPELVATYFAERNLQMEPKLSNTWIGYASLLFEIVSLPLPPFMGNELDWADVPPQTRIIMENILPSPLSQKVLTRCLNQSNELITFFATRILIIALRKLGDVLGVLRSRAAAGNGLLWEQAAERTLQSFSASCPIMKDVVQVFRQIPDDDQRAMQREAITRVLRLYYEVMPLQALEENFDISAGLTSALTRGEGPMERVSAEVKELRMLELEHMLFIARQSPAMRWFHKQGALRHSPIVALLRLHVQDPLNAPIRSLVGQILTDNNILSPPESTVTHPADALVASLVHVSLDSSVWTFVDDCIARTSRQPIKYVDMIEALHAGERVGPLPSPLAAAVLEQASFVVAKPDVEREAQMQFINLFVILFQQTTSDDDMAFPALRKRITKIKGWKSPPKGLDASAHVETVRILSSSEAPRDDKAVAIHAQDQDSSMFRDPPVESQSHPELYRWSQKELDMAFEDGDISGLILCLCSQYADIRMQARAQLLKLMHELRSNTTNENAQQISVLVGELCETFEQQCLPRSAALPYLAGTFAVRALQVQTQPSHFMYPKLNQYLIRGPEWGIRRLPSYWLSKSVLSTPEDDDAYWKEVQWVLDWLVDGLRSRDDLDIVRRCDAFESIMSLWTSPSAARQKHVRDRILELLHRATCVEGGSNTVITRVGALSWLDMVQQDPKHSAICDALRRRITRTVDAERLRHFARDADVGGPRAEGVGKALKA